MKIDSIDRLRDIRDALLVEQGINPTRNGEQAIRVVVDRIDEIQNTLDKRTNTLSFLKIILIKDLLYFYINHFSDRLYNVNYINQKQETISSS